MVFGVDVMGGYADMVEERSKHRDGCPYSTINVRSDCKNFSGVHSPCKDIEVCLAYKAMPIEQGAEVKR